VPPIFLVRLHTSLPPSKIGLAPWPNPPGDTRSDMPMGPNAGETEVLITAGYVRKVYDATFTLSPDGKRYNAVNTNMPVMLPEPGLPFSLVFRAEPGAEDGILRVASACEAASKRRISPPMFGPLCSRTW
jgi:amidase